MMPGFVPGHWRVKGTRAISRVGDAGGQDDVPRERLKIWSQLVGMKGELEPTALSLGPARFFHCP